MTQGFLKSQECILTPLRPEPALQNSSRTSKSCWRVQSDREHMFLISREYTTAAKECLQLGLCNRHNFSREATESTRRDKTLRRNKPSAWLTRLGVHSKIWRARHRLKVLQRRSVEARISIDLQTSFPQNSSEHEYCRSLSYRWSLDLLPFFLKNSAISLELAEVLRGCTFTTMGWKFPRRMRLAKDAITRYLSRVGAVVGDP